MGETGLFRLLIRKMLNTRWMVLCLLIGFLLASAMMSTIPIYMDGSLQRMLRKDMESFQLENNQYPGAYSLSKKFTFGSSNDGNMSAINALQEEIQQRTEDIKMPVLTKKLLIQDDFLNIRTGYGDKTSDHRVSVATMEGFEDHIQIDSGRMFENTDDGVVEVVATENVLANCDMMVGREYDVSSYTAPDKGTFKIRVVGTWTLKEETDPYWNEMVDSYPSHFFTTQEALNDVLVKNGVYLIQNAQWLYTFDYHQLKATDISATSAALQSDKMWAQDNDLDFSMPSMEILQSYVVRADNLVKVLWVLQIPILLMLAFYLFMVSQLNVEAERNEIAVYKSRGASGWQVFRIYAMEVLLLGAVTFVIGPLLGLLFCRVLGVSNGFLEFINRPALPVKITITAVACSLLAVVFFFIMTMLPILPASKTSIVEHKAKKTKKRFKALWEKFFLDFVLLGASLYWLFTYLKQQEKLAELNIDASSQAMDPLIFVASTLFVLGAGLVCLRLYPYAVRLVYFLGRRVWSPAAYISLTNVGRDSSGRERFLMIFLILTVALGIFSANTARAVNQNMEESVEYNNGAPVVVTQNWDPPKEATPPSQSGAMQTAPAEEETETGQEEIVEPPFEKFEQLDTVEHATKVMRRNDVSVSGEYDSFSDVNLMAIVPDEFAQTANMISRLYPIHFYYYTNALVDNPGGVILSSSFQENSQLELGDVIQMQWMIDGKKSSVKVQIMGFVDYWPTMSPFKDDKSGDKNLFMITNFRYTTNNMNLSPYEVWLQPKDGVTSQQLYDELEEDNIKCLSVKNTTQDIVAAKNDPIIQGMNGALTMGFIITMVMCIIGFLMYWILSIKGRTLQFGILRAMGVSYREIITMLLYEQVLVSGVAIVLAIVVGGVASQLFVPIYKYVFDFGNLQIPFTVAPMRSDYIKLYLIIGVMLVIGFAVLGRLISKIKISQALKLGED